MKISRTSFITIAHNNPDDLEIHTLNTKTQGLDLASWILYVYDFLCVCVVDERAGSKYFIILSIKLREVFLGSGWLPNMGARWDW